MIIIKQGQHDMVANGAYSCCEMWSLCWISHPHIYYLFHFLLCDALLRHFILFLSHGSFLSLKEIHILSCFCIVFFLLLSYGFLLVFLLFPCRCFVFGKWASECVCVWAHIPFRHMKNGHWLRRSRIILKLASYHIRLNANAGVKKYTNEPS